MRTQNNDKVNQTRAENFAHFKVAHAIGNQEVIIIDIGAEIAWKFGFLNGLQQAGICTCKK